MDIHPLYYRQQGEIYPPNTPILTKDGIFPIEIEYYLGQAGADAVFGVGIERSQDMQNVYAPFMNYNEKDVEILKPKIEAFEQTFVIPISLGKKSYKAHKDLNCMRLISLVGGIAIFAISYTFVRDFKTISHSMRVIKQTAYIQKFLSESNIDDHRVRKDPIYQKLYKILKLRTNIYKRHLVSSIISLAMTTMIVALSILAAISAGLGCFPLLAACLLSAGALIVGYILKCGLEWNGRMDRKNAYKILDKTESLRHAFPHYIEQGL